MHRIVAYTFPNIYEKIHQFLSSIKRDAHKRKLVPSFLPHSIDTRNVLLLRLLVLSIIIIIHEYYYGGAVALLLQDHLTMSVSRFGHGVANSRIEDG